MSRQYFVWSLLVCASLLRADQPTALLPAADTVHATVETHYLSWDGRVLAVVDTGVSMHPTGALSAGADARRSAGHGRSHDNRYAGDGWAAWGQWQLSARPGRPGLALRVEHAADAVHISSKDAASLLAADPTTASTGLLLAVTAPGDALEARAVAGMYAVSLNGRPVATVRMLGGILTVPLGTRTRAQLALTGYQDQYLGRHFSPRVEVMLATLPTSRGGLRLGASIFPRGVPLAGTPLSAPSVIGAVYGSSAGAQLRTHAVGYLSLAVDYRW